MSIPERTQIKEQVNQIISYVNEGNFNAISNILSPNCRIGLKDKIEKQLAEKNIKYKKVLIGSYKKIENNQIKASGSYEIKSPNWEGSGSLMYFTFEKIGTFL